MRRAGPGVRAASAGSVGTGTRLSENVGSVDSHNISFIPSPQIISTHSLMLNIQK